MVIKDFKLGISEPLEGMAMKSPIEAIESIVLETLCTKVSKQVLVLPSHFGTQNACEYMSSCNHNHSLTLHLLGTGMLLTGWMWCSLSYPQKVGSII